MAEAKIQKRNTYTIYDDEGIGTVQIADMEEQEHWKRLVRNLM